MHGIICSALDWVRDYLHNRRHVTAFNGKESRESTTNIGVPQGSILGPLLFLVYINDLSDVTASGDVLLFADDANHYESGHNIFELLNSVNENLQTIVNWFLANKLAINLIKTEAMVLSRKPLYFPLPPVLVNNKPLPYSHTFKFLGLLIDNRLNWKSHISAIRSKLSTVCGIIYRIRNRISISISKLLYNSIKYPHIIYGNIIWSAAYECNMQCLSVAQKKLIRTILRKPRYEHTSPLFKRLNILKLNDVSKFCTLQFVYKT